MTLDDLKTSLEIVNAKIERNKYWLLLQTLKMEYSSSHHSIKFEEWVEDKHGFKIMFQGGMITDTYKIVDEAKYIFFVLKYK